MGTNYRCREWTNGGGSRTTWWTGPACGILRGLDRPAAAAVVTAAPGFWAGGDSDAAEDAIGREPSVKAYVDRVSRVLAEAGAVLEPGGTLWATIPEACYAGRGRNIGEGQTLRLLDQPGGLGIGLRRKTVLGLPWAVAHQMLLRGWAVRSTIHWVRAGNGRRRQDAARRDRPRQQTEMLFLLARERHYRYEPRSWPEDPADDVWIVPGGRAGRSMPAGLAARCLDLAGVRENDTVVDPFAGEAGALIAAAAIGGNGIGIGQHVAEETAAYDSLHEPVQPSLREYPQVQLPGSETRATVQA